MLEDTLQHRFCIAEILDDYPPLALRSNVPGLIETSSGGT